MGKVEHPANAGDVILLPNGIPHVHPWNVGNDVLHVRKITQLDKPDKGLLLKSEEVFETLYALAQEGKTDTDGLPKNLLQKVVVGQALEPASYSATPLSGFSVRVRAVGSHRASFRIVSTIQPNTYFHDT